MSTITATYIMEDQKSGLSSQYSWQAGARNPLPMPRLASYDTPPVSSSPSSSMILPYHGGSSSHSSSTIYRPMPPLHQDSLHSPSLRQQPSIPTRPPLMTHHSFPSSKRTYAELADSQYADPQQESYDSSLDSEGTKFNISPDHRLLSFSRLPDRSTVLDQHGRPRQLEIAAQIHGMFFLSEIATNSGNGIVIQPELTCYRRNLFQISGSVTGPSAQLSVLNDRNQSVPIVSQELSISAMESVDKHDIKLIVIPWKTPPPNAPEPPSSDKEHTPTAVPIFEGINDQNADTDLTVQPIAWRRLQFRVATANNGRRKELQQHFLLRLTLSATLADGSKVITAETSTAPIVVRGRSPRNFQARKEIPLLGSSASSRGLASQPSPQREPSNALERTNTQKPKSVELPKMPFQFDPSNFPPSPLLVRNNYGQWSQSGHNQATTTPNYPPPMTLNGYTQMPGSMTENTNSSSQTSNLVTPLSSSETSRPPFYHSSTAPMPSLSLTYQHQGSDPSNPRPSKSPRHVLPPDLSSLPTYSGFEHRLLPPNPSYPPAPTHHHQAEPRDYFPQIQSSSAAVGQSWTSSEQSGVLYQTSSSMPPPPPVSAGNSYAFPPQNGYVKGDASGEGAHYTWGQ